jgi:TrmH family RNA methyltransferase
MHIESTQNPKFKTMLRWREKSSARRKDGICLVEGLREVERALDSGWTPILALHRDGVELAQGLRSFTCAPAVFDRLVIRKGSAEVLVAFEPKRWTLDTLTLPQDALVLVADGTEKPGNLGAMLRTANATGVDAVIASSTLSDLYAPEVVRNSLGGLFGTPVVEAPRAEVQNWLRAESFTSFQLHLDGAESPYATDLKGRVALVLGAEDQGLDTSWNEAAPHRLKLPMQGVVDSLNVSVATGVILYEALRQRSVR